MVEQTFVEIERILGAMLPKSANRLSWWGNEIAPGSTHVQCAAWLSAGFKVRLISGAERVQFERLPR